MTTKKVASMAEYREKQAAELFKQRQAERRIVGYKLIGKSHKVIACYDLLPWAKWFEKADRAVGRTTLGPFEVKTSFLGIDYNFHDEGPPLIFETMIFTADLSGKKHGGNVPMKGHMESFFGYMRRYSTWDQAMKGHLEVCRELRDQLSKGHPQANKRRMRALHERHYERLQTAKLARYPRLRIVGAG